MLNQEEKEFALQACDSAFSVFDLFVDGLILKTDAVGRLIELGYDTMEKQSAIWTQYKKGV